MGYKKLSILVLAILMLLPAATAFSVSFTNINNSIFRDQTATFAMTVVNSKGYEDTFQVSTRDPNWILSTNPPLGTIPSLSTKSYVLSIKPKQSVELGPHAVPLKIRSLRSGEFKENNLLVNLKPRTPFGGEYAPAVQLQVEMETPVDPREKVPVTIKMDNKNPRDMPNLNVLVDGRIFYKNYTLHLSPLEQKTSEILFEPDPITEPGVYTLDVRLILENISVAHVSKEFEVIEYGETQEEVIKQTNFFKITKDIQMRNDGNVEREIVKRIQVPFYKDLFTSFDPEPEEVTERGETYYQWSREVGPQETFTITSYENYRIPVMVLIAAILALIAYYIFRSPVVVSKIALAEEKGADKTVIKVRLEVKNRSKEKIRNVTILDKIPSMADFVKKTEPGTLKPEKVVKSSSKGTSVRWEIDSLDPHEERIITYRIKCKLRIVGGMNLPPAKVKFESGEGKERASYSNKVTVQEG